MDCVCVPSRKWMDKTNYLNAFERGMVVGARRTGLSVSRTATCLSRMVHHPKSIQTSWHKFEKHWSQHGPACLRNTLDTLWSLCPNELRLFWGQKGVQLNIMKGVPNDFPTQCTLCYLGQKGGKINRGFNSTNTVISAPRSCLWGE